MMPIQYKRWISIRSIVPPRINREQIVLLRENIRSNGFLRIKEL